MRVFRKEYPFLFLKAKETAPKNECKPTHSKKGKNHYSDYILQSSTQNRSSLFYMHNTLPDGLSSIREKAMPKLITIAFHKIRPFSPQMPIAAKGHKNIGSYSHYYCSHTP
jgi:hypothetical protein